VEINHFYSELESLLPQSTTHHRKIWASKIIQNDIDLNQLIPLIKSKKKVSTRFLWLLSEVGNLNPNKLLQILPLLLKLSHTVDINNSIATFWLIAGIPTENEAQSIDLLFNWIQSSSTNVTTKSRSILVVLNLTIKYPELKNELKICLEDQLNKYTADFNKKVIKILKTLE